MRPGTAGELYVQDFDGKAYSGWNAHVHVAVPNTNSAPTISLPSGAAVQATTAQSLATSGLFSGSEVDGDTLTYFVYDSNATANSGHFGINGAAVPALTITQVSSTNGADDFRGGPGGYHRPSLRRSLRRQGVFALDRIPRIRLSLGWPQVRGV